MGSDAFTQSLEGGQYLTNALYYEQYNNYHHGEEGKQIADDIGYTDSNGQEWKRNKKEASLWNQI